MPLIHLSNIDNYSSEKVPGMPGIKPGAAGREASMLPLCYAASLHDAFLHLITLFLPGRNWRDFWRCRG